MTDTRSPAAASLHTPAQPTPAQPTPVLPTPGPGATAPAPPARGRMERRVLALMTDTGANAVLGIVFWAAAARLYSPDQVGRASALITAATLLSTLAQLNLGNVYARFLGPAGRRQRPMVLAGYAGVVLLALLLGVGYAVLGPGDVLFADVLERWLFPAAVAVLAIFVLQDMILISLDRAMWVPVENIAWGLAKLGLLVGVATVQPVHGIVLSWIVPSLAALLAVSAYLCLRRWPSGPPARLPGRRELTSAVGGEYVIGLVSTAVPLALPLLVVHQLGLAANAYFSVPWLFASSLSLLMWNVASILLVEASSRPAHLAALLRRALRMALAVGVLGGVGLWTVGPLLLSVLGPAYAENSVWLLRFTALAAPAVAIVVVWTTAARSQGWLRAVLGLQLGIGVSLLGLATVLLHRWEAVAGIGVAFAMVQWTAALMVLPSLHRLLGGRRRTRGLHRRGRATTDPTRTRSAST